MEHWAYCLQVCQWPQNTTYTPSLLTHHDVPPPQIWYHDVPCLSLCHSLFTPKPLTSRNLALRVKTTTLSLAQAQWKTKKTRPTERFPLVFCKDLFFFLLPLVLEPREDVFLLRNSELLSQSLLITFNCCSFICNLNSRSGFAFDNTWRQELNLRPQHQAVWISVDLVSM